MSSRHRLKPSAPLRSALPDVFLRKNKFEERMLENKRNFLEKIERKVIDRLAREQEEFAILNCVCIGNDSDTFECYSDTFENHLEPSEGNSDTLSSSSKEVHFSKEISDFENNMCNGLTKSGNTSQNGYDAYSIIERARFPEKRRHSEGFTPVKKINRPNAHSGNFKRSNSDSSLLDYSRKMSKKRLENIPEVKKVEENRSTVRSIYSEDQETNEKCSFSGPPLRPSLSLPEGTRLASFRNAKGNSNAIKTRAKSAPPERTRFSFSGRDGRKMSLTPVIKQFSDVSLNNACSRPYTAGVKVIRDLPKTTQVELKNSVHFLSQHMIRQQNEISKIRTRRALMSAKTKSQND